MDLPIWAWAAIAALGVLVLGIGGYFLWKWVWFRLSRRHLVGLIGRRENITASRRSLENVVMHLADLSDEELVGFAEDPESVDRKALMEVNARMRILADELWTIPLPKRLWPAGEALGDAAATIADEAGRITDLMEADEVLAGLAAVDLAAVGRDYERADALVNEACSSYHVEDAAVYGGGLYI